MTWITITVQGELLARLDQIPKKMRSAVEEKFRTVLEEAYSKAILQFSGGKYSATTEVEHGVEVQGSLLIGYMEPLTAKAGVQEYGGKGFYVIEAVNAKTLRFFWDKVGAVVFPKSVLHPPLAGKHYIRSALMEAIPILETEIQIAIDESKS